MKRRLLSWCLALCMTLTLIPAPVYATMAEELGLQEILLPITLADGPASPDPESSSNLIEVGSTTAFVYEGANRIYVDFNLQLLDENGDILGESAGLDNTSGIIQLLDAENNVVAHSDSVTARMEYHWDYDAGIRIFDYFYVSRPTFRSSDTQDLTELEVGKYSMRFVSGSNAEDIYPCSGTVEVVTSNSIFLHSSGADLYIGAKYAEATFSFFGISNEDELEKFSCNLLDASTGAVVGSSTGRFRNVYTSESSGLPCIAVEAEIVLIDGAVIEDDTEYTLQLLYSGTEKPLYSAVHTVTCYPREAQVIIADAVILDPQESRIAVTLENWAEDDLYLLEVHSSTRGSSESLVGRYSGTIPADGVVEIALGQNGISLPMANLGEQLNITLYTVAGNNDRYSHQLSNPYSDPDYSSGSSGIELNVTPRNMAAGVENQTFSVTVWDTASTGRDTLSLQDASGNTVASGIITVEEEDDYSFSGTVTLHFTGGAKKGAYTVCLNDVLTERTVRVTDQLQISSDLYQIDEGADYSSAEDNFFFTLLGEFPVSFGVINGGNTATIDLVEAELITESDEYETWSYLIPKEDADPVFSSGMLSGESGEYDGYTYFNHSFTYDQLKDLNEESYYVLVLTTGGQSEYFELGRFDSTVCVVDFAALTDPNYNDPYYIGVDGTHEGDTTVSMEFYFHSDRSDSLRNLTEEALEAGVKQLSFSHLETGNSVTVTGCGDIRMQSRGSYLTTTLTLSGPLSAGSHMICFNGHELDRNLYAQEVSDEVYPPHLNYENYLKDGYISGNWLPEGSYTAKLYDGYTCLTDKAVTLTLEGEHGYEQHLRFPENAFGTLEVGTYELRVYLDGTLLDAVDLIAEIATRPTVQLITGLYDNTASLITSSPYYRLAVMNPGIYTKIRAAESKEALANAAYDKLSGSYSPQYRFESSGEKVIYAQLASGSGENLTESDVYALHVWYRTDDTLLPVYVHEDMEGLYNGNKVTFSMGADTRFAQAWMEGTTADGETVTVPLAYAGLGELPSPRDTAKSVISCQPYDDSPEVWHYTVADAEQLLVSFSSDTLLDDEDALYIYAGDYSLDELLPPATGEEESSSQTPIKENLVGKYSEDELAGRTVTVPSGTFTLLLVAGYNYSDFGFTVTSVVDPDAPVEEPEDTSHYKHIFTTPDYRVDEYIPESGVRVRDLTSFSFYLTDENGNVLSETETRSLVFRDPDEILLPWLNGSETLINTSTFLLYGYTSPNCGVSVSYSYYSSSQGYQYVTLETVSDQQGYFSFQLTGLEDDEYYLYISDDDYDTDDPSPTLRVDRTAPVIESADFSFSSSTDSVSTLNWVCYDYDVDHFSVLCTEKNGTSSMVQQYIYPSSSSNGYSYNSVVTASRDDGKVFTIRAYDRAGNMSEVELSTADTVPPTAPGEIEIVSRTTTSVTVRWSEGKDDNELSGYDVYLNGTRVAKNYAGLSYTFSGLENGSSCAIAVKSRDKAGNTSLSETSISASPVVLTPVLELEERYVADLYADKLIPLSYEVTDDDADFSPTVRSAELRFRRANSNEGWTAAALNADGTGSWNISGSDDGLLPLGTYEFILTVTDSENVTVESKTFTAILGLDVTPPTAPSDLSLITYGTTIISFSWLASEDNVAVDHYEIWRDGVRIAETEDTSFSDTGLALSTEYEYCVKAVDGRGNVSESSEYVTFRTLTLEFANVTAFDKSYVLEDQKAQLIPMEATVQAEEGYTPTVSVSMEYRAAGSESWITETMTQDASEPSMFYGFWRIGSYTQDAESGKTVLRYLEPGSYEIRFVVTDIADPENPVSAYSDIQTVALMGETEAPVITNTSPDGETPYSRLTLLEASATDNVGVTAMRFYLVGETENTLLYEKADESYLRYEWDISALSDGTHEVMVEAEDARGNVGRETITVLVDNTPPDVPVGVTATVTSRYIHILWDVENYNRSDDFSHFCVYRYTPLNHIPQLVSSSASIGYYDDSRTADAGTPYTYFVTAVDNLGNESQHSAPVSATFRPDEESPVIRDMMPRANALLRRSVTLEVSATDNYRLSTAIFSYRKVGSSKWIEIGRDTVTGITASKTFSYDWTIPSEITESAAYEIRAQVYDVSFEEIPADSAYSCNAPAELIRTVTIHPYASPVAPNVKAEAAYKKATLSWTYDGDVETLKHFAIYQDLGKASKFITSVKAGTSGSYTVTLPKTGEQTYIIVAEDRYGETAASTISVTSAAGEDIPPVAVIAPEQLNAAAGKPFHFSATASTDNDAIASYAWNFGDGSTGSGDVVSHTYAAPGDYTVTLTVTDECGNADTATATVAVHDISSPGADYAIAEITVVNGFAAGTPAVEGAELTFTFTDSYGTTTYETSGMTDANGLVNLVVPAESGVVTVTADGFLATSRTLEVAPDASGTFSHTLGLTPMNVSVADGSLSVEEMTYSEIVQAGISITAPENNHVWKFSAELEFTAGPAFPFDLPKFPVTGYFDDWGNFLGGFGWGWTSLDDDEDEGGGGTGLNLKVGVFPISERFILVIYGEAHWLKEMYNVELLVINNSYLDPITNCEATLSLPDGLALADMTYGEQNETIHIADVAPKDSEDDDANIAKVNWYVRGDKEGEYHLTATVSGSNPDPFVREFTTDSPLKVYAGNALHLTIRAEDIAYKEEEYHVQFELTNVSSKELYNLSFAITGAEQYRVFTVGDNETRTQLTQEDFGSSMTKKIKTLKPGESIVVDFYTTVWFTSLLEFADLGPFDVGYYLRNVFVTTLEGSTTTIPHSVEIIKSSHGTFFEWVADQVDGGIQDVIINVVDDVIFDEIPFVSTGKKIYDFAHTADRGDPASRCEITLDNGTFKQSGNILRSRSVTPGAITVYTDSTDYELSADGKTMIINDNARVYVEGVQDGRTSMTVKTYALRNAGTEDETLAENVYTLSYNVGGAAGDAADLILQEPLSGLVDGKTSVPFAGYTKEITFPYLLMDANGNYFTAAPNAKWTVTGEDTTGLTMENGVLTIGSTAKGGDYTVALTVGEKSATQTFTLTREASVAQRVRITRAGIRLDGDTVGANSSYTYTAVAIDQYGVDFVTDTEWAASGSISGVTFSDGTLTVAENAASGTLTLTATVDGKHSSITVAVMEKGAIAVQNVTSDTSTASAEIVNNSGVTAELQGMLVAYDENGQMIGFGVASGTLADGERLNLTLTGRSGSTIADVRVFVLNTDTSQPLAEAK